MMRFPAIAVLFAFSQVSAIQVECRQCQLVRQNEEYFERAKQAVQKRRAPTSVVVPVSSTSIATEQVMDRDNDIPAPEAPLVEMAASTAFVPKQNTDNIFGFASQTGLQETVFAYRTSYQ
jgi:hypothetical protein